MNHCTSTALNSVVETRADMALRSRLVVNDSLPFLVRSLVLLNKINTTQHGGIYYLLPLLCRRMPTYGIYLFPDPHVMSPSFRIVLSIYKNIKGLAFSNLSNIQRRREKGELSAVDAPDCIGPKRIYQ